MNVKNCESIYVLRNLISIHSMLNNSCGLEVKKAINKSIMESMYWFYNEVGEKDFQNHIITNTHVYCWTKDKIEKLKTLDDVILCTSKERNAFNKNYDIFCDKKYKYYYKLHIKENCFGVDLNSFNYKIFKKDLDGYAYHGNIHYKEQEILVNLKDIDTYELIK